MVFDSLGQTRPDPGNLFELSSVGAIEIRQGG
jgi:hypothetical protein